MSLAATASELESSTGLTAFVHATQIHGGATAGLRAEELVVTASVFKIPVLVEACEQMAQGAISADEQVHLGPDDFTVLGGTGIAGFRGPVTLSFQDLCLSMMQVSDNRATDVVMDMVGIGAINDRLRELGLTQTVLEGDCRHLFATMREDLAELGHHGLERFADAGEDVLRCRAIDPQRANRSTPEETTRLLAELWRQDQLTPSACAEAQYVLGEQAWGHRLSSGFPSDRIAKYGKTGTLPYIRNEAGVVEYPDGQLYAVAVFLRLPTPESAVPHFDAAIGTLAAAAVEELRG